MDLEKVNSKTGGKLVPKGKTPTLREALTKNKAKSKGGSSAISESGESSSASGSSSSSDLNIE